MRFRPCIDIHNGKVKQIVGSSISDTGDTARENYVATQDAAHFARLYQEKGITGGHIILLNPDTSEYYAETKKQAIAALQAYPQGMHVGGGICDTNAEDFLRAGASHVIVTSFVFQDSRINYEHLDKMIKAVGKEHLVLDLSCRKKEDAYYIVTDRWQKYTTEKVDKSSLEKLSDFCDEFLIHAVDVEGKNSGIEVELAALLGDFTRIPVTYAGGVHSFSDLDLLGTLGRNRVDVTIGSALDLFGGRMKFEEVLAYFNRRF